MVQVAGTDKSRARNAKPTITTTLSKQEMLRGMPTMMKTTFTTTNASANTNTNTNARTNANVKINKATTVGLSWSD